jgi:hypothetical protein
MVSLPLERIELLGIELKEFETRYGAGEIETDLIHR